MVYETISLQEKEAQELRSLSFLAEKRKLQESMKRANKRAKAAEAKAAKKEKEMKQLVAGIGVFSMIALMMSIAQSHPFWYCGFPILVIVYLMKKVGWL